MPLRLVKLQISNFCSRFPFKHPDAIKQIEPSSKTASVAPYQVLAVSHITWEGCCLHKQKKLTPSLLGFTSNFAGDCKWFLRSAPAPVVYTGTTVVDLVLAEILWLQIGRKLFVLGWVGGGTIDPVKSLGRSCICPSALSIRSPDFTNFSPFVRSFVSPSRRRRLSRAVMCC